MTAVRDMAGATKRGTPAWHIAQVREWRDAGYPPNRVPLNSIEFLLTEAERTHGK